MGLQVIEQRDRHELGLMLLDEEAAPVMDQDAALLDFAGAVGKCARRSEQMDSDDVGHVDDLGQDLQEAVATDRARLGEVRGVAALEVDHGALEEEPVDVDRIVRRRHAQGMDEVHHLGDAGVDILVDLAAGEPQHGPSEPLQIALAAAVADAIVDRGMGAMSIQLDRKLVRADDEVSAIASDHLLGFDRKAGRAARFREFAFDVGLSYVAAFVRED